MLCHATPCCAMLCHAMPCLWKTYLSVPLWLDAYLYVHGPVGSAIWSRLWLSRFDYQCYLCLWDISSGCMFFSLGAAHQLYLINTWSAPRLNKAFANTIINDSWWLTGGRGYASWWLADAWQVEGGLDQFKLRGGCTHFVLSLTTYQRWRGFNCYSCEPVVVVIVVVAAAAV